MRESKAAAGYISVLSINVLEIHHLASSCAFSGWRWSGIPAFAIVPACKKTERS